MIELLGTIFGGIFSGGATGIIGVLVQRYFDAKNKALDLEVEKMRGDIALSMKDKDLAIVQAEYAMRAKIATTEGESKSDAAASDAFATSYKLEPTRYSDAATLTKGQQWFMVLLDCVRGIVRPGLTIYLCVLTTWIYFEARAVLNVAPLDPAEAAKLVHLVVGTILYLMTTCVLWWFGTRNKQHPPQP